MQPSKNQGQTASRQGENRMQVTSQRKQTEKRKGSLIPAMFRRRSEAQAKAREGWQRSICGEGSQRGGKQ